MASPPLTRPGGLAGTPATAFDAPQATTGDVVAARQAMRHVVAMLFAATSVVVGVIWDISWHMTIGRDTFWTPAHLAIYLGGIVGGIASGLVVLRTTFARDTAHRAHAVRFWGFQGPLGAWVSIWGAFAMVTSAPFDDWWHNAYGLDVEILSPPHVVLALGMVALAVGAMLVTLAHQNRADGADARRFGWMYSYAAGCVLAFLAILITDWSWRVLQHGSAFYWTASLVFPFFLAAAGNASRLRWGATAIAAAYMAIRIAMLWILPLFPAEPGLGPIYQSVTHMIPMEFPLLLVVPAVAMDLARHRVPPRRWILLGVTQGVGFFVALLVVQWYFAGFLLSEASRTWIFGTHYLPYSVPGTSSLARHVFVQQHASSASLAWGLLAAAGNAVISALVGVQWSRWYQRVRR
jgi:hypothetical protein